MKIGPEPRQMDIFSFINAKLKVDDVEAMYSAIVRSKLSLKTRQLICLAEGLSDHLGLASQMAEGGDSFWAAAMRFVKQGVRGGARRHFRAEVAKDAIVSLSRSFSPPSKFFDQMPPTYRAAKEYITGLPQFGPFSAFKIADMAERTCGTKVDFSGIKMDGLSKFPRRGLQLAAEYLDTEPETLLDDLLGHKWCMLAPPHRDRRLNIQEIETCLCNYGHSKWHPPGYEADELKKILVGYGKLADTIRRNLP